MRYSTLLRGMIAGMVGGLAATISMYLFGAGIFTLLGWPANTSFLIIGDSAAAFFSKTGIVLAGGVALGVRLYFLIGLLFGVSLGIAITSIEPLRHLSSIKKVAVSVLYVEVMSLPLLAAGSLALKMSAASAGLWFSISVIMHLMYGLILGVVICYGVGDVIRKSEGHDEGASYGKPSST